MRTSAKERTYGDEKLIILLLGLSLYMHTRYALNNYDMHAFNIKLTYYSRVTQWVDGTCYTELLQITRDFREVGGYQRLLEITTDYWRLPEITIEYYRFLEITREST